MTDIDNNSQIDQDQENINSNDLNEQLQANGSADGDEEMAPENHLFKHGDILNFIRVRFPGNAKSFSFYMGDRKLMYGQKVVAMSDRGIAVGYINSFPYQLVYTKDMPAIRSILRVATEEDLQTERETYKKQKEVESLCIDLITKHQLDMNMTHVEFTQFGKKVVFYFTAPARVDFRGLVKDLVGELKLRIELRQISVRDRSASVGGLGPCGRQLCCSSFLSRYGNVNIKMAKNQDLTLSFNKLNGVCGQLKCCLQYEDEVYSHKRRNLPRIGQFIETYNGDRGVVERLHILSERFDLLTDRGIMRSYSIGQFKAELPQDYRMPDRFDHIADERSNVIGISEDQAKKALEFEKEVEELKKRNNVFGENIFLKHFGERTTLNEEEYKQSLEALAEQKNDIKASFEIESNVESFIPQSEFDDESNDEGFDDADGDEEDEDETFETQPTNRSQNQNARPQQARQQQRPQNNQPNRNNQRRDFQPRRPQNTEGNPSAEGGANQERPQHSGRNRNYRGSKPRRFDSGNQPRQGGGPNRNNQGRNNQ
jgi:cell fate regulator YaaT (PSP1 superfamily)